MSQVGRCVMHVYNNPWCTYSIARQAETGQTIKPREKKTGKIEVSRSCANTRGTAQSTLFEVDPFLKAARDINQPVLLLQVTTKNDTRQHASNTLLFKLLA